MEITVQRIFKPMKIQELFDPGKRLDRKIESVVTFADKNEDDLKKEINEYVVTDKLKDSYYKVIDLMQDGFNNTTNEVGIWVSGFYGSGKSSFAKYLGFSFDSSLVVDGITFGEKLMNRINDSQISSMHKGIIRNYNPTVVMIDLMTKGIIGKTSNISDIIYYESLKTLGITSSTEPKIIYFVSLLKELGKYDDFVRLVKEKKKIDWSEVEKNSLLSEIIAAELAPEILPDLFSSTEEFRSIKIESIENEEERIIRLVNLFKEITGNDKILFILDEVGHHVAASIGLISNLQGFMHTIKSKFKGNVWLIATAQQTLTEDNPHAQLNSNALFPLNDRFPIKVDIQAEDIKEIITKRLLGKSSTGSETLMNLFRENEGSIKLNTKLNLEKTKSRYIHIPEAQIFANLYPFLPVHIDILLALLQKLASRTGGYGLRSVIRLIRDILVDNHLAEANVGVLANPSHFYDVLKTDMEKHADYKEIVQSATQAVNQFSHDPMATALIKTIAVMQILDDFPLTLDNISALLYLEIGKDVNKTAIKNLLDEIKKVSGITLEEVDGKYRFMTNAILSVKEERNKITVTDPQRDEILKELVKDLLSPAPQVQIFSKKTIKPTIELAVGRRTITIHSGDHLKIIFYFVQPGEFHNMESDLRTRSTDRANEKTMFVISTLHQSIASLLFEIGQDEAIVNAHRNDSNKEVRDYLKSQEEDAKSKRQEIIRLLKLALSNSESIWQGQVEAVNETTYVSKSLKKFAEKIFEKFNYAPETVGGSIIKELAKYDNWNALPSSLNPMRFIDNSGTINTSADALRDLYDYISANEPEGVRLLNDFESSPYGWAKDTTRYLVALLLKDNKIVLRAGAQSYKMLTDKAADAMKTNSTFNSIGLSRNNEKQLTPAERLKAKKELTELFNPGNITLTVDSIAKAAFRAMTAGKFKDTAESLSLSYNTVKLAGQDTVKKAIDYANQIIQSEGMDAPVLFAQVDECVNSMRYVLQVSKSGVMDTILKINRRFKDINDLTKLPQLDVFFKEVNDLNEVYNSLLNEKNCYDHKSEYSDIASKLEESIRNASIEFCQRQNLEIDKKIDEEIALHDVSSLTMEQLENLNSLSSRIHLAEGDGTLNDLKNTINKYNLAFNPSGPVYQLGLTIEKWIKENKEKNETPEIPETPESETSDDDKPSSAQEPEVKTSIPVRVQKTLNKVDLKALIERLNRTMEGMIESDTIEINLF